MEHKMQNVFRFRDDLIGAYSSFSRSFIQINAQDIYEEIEKEYQAGRYWPEPLIQINPNYERKDTVQSLAEQGVLHQKCAQIFQTGKGEGSPEPLHLYTHQLEAIAKARQAKSYVVTTGTGSGKSLAFFIPIVDSILKAKEHDPTPRTHAIIIYPMNALANSQMEELNKFLHGFSEDRKPFTVARYTGQENNTARKLIAENPPDILLTNFMMLELILTRYEEVDRQVVEHCRDLHFLVLDELHTYRGRQGADVAMLVRRLKQRLDAEELICIGTSATMSSKGSPEDQQKTVAQVASKLFGTTILQHDVIQETLERVTDRSQALPAVIPKLQERVQKQHFVWPDFDAFKNDPLSIWVELVLGIDMSDLSTPRRAKPLTLREASARLAEDASVDPVKAVTILQEFLISAQNVFTPKGRQPFAFKLHQFISGPGKVYCTLESEGLRHITLDAQRFAPGRQDEGVLLFSTHFCRECGQEYHPVWEEPEPNQRFGPREIDDIMAEDDDVRFGFLAPRNPHQQYKGQLEDLPEGWIDFSKSKPKIKQTYKKSIPQAINVDMTGAKNNGVEYWFIPGKFRFCLNCGHVHETYGKDINRLSGLSGEGRSSATTMLTLSILRQLFSDEEIAEEVFDPRKLLGFTDNRQDAALQAGHFNDFLFLLMLRSGLIGALNRNSGELTDENLADEVFKALGFNRNDEGTLCEYLKNPSILGLAKQEAQRTLRFILGYRLIFDLRKGWRYNNPNLDQLKLLEIDYLDIEAFSSQESIFSDTVLQRLGNNGRAAFARFVLNQMCKNLCIESIYLDVVEQDKARTRSYNYLKEPWAFEPDEQTVTSKFLVLGQRPEYRGRVRVDTIGAGERSRFIRLLRNAEFWNSSEFSGQVSGWTGKRLVEIVTDFLETASTYGYIQKQHIDQNTNGFRLKSSAMKWRLVQNLSLKEEQKINTFFRRLYLSVAETLSLPSHSFFEFEAHEHTAQVDAGKRLFLEARFRYSRQDKENWLSETSGEGPLTRLPVLFCSPTMELGVDISALNTVYLRNVPPTPANYAQRSGRAGRSGQAALVVTYCAAMSPHDQWFFHHATDMVHGVVKPPTLDLANRDLIESHLQAIWLAAVEQKIETSIAPLLDLDQENKPLKEMLQERFNDTDALSRAREQAGRVINEVKNELTPVNCSWFNDEFVDTVINNAPMSFNKAIDRWRNLYDATIKQMALADQAIKDHAAGHRARENAKRRYIDAQKQHQVLLKEGNTQNSDFYTFRYLGSQGFLPGYNFPRLPLMAWIPARGGVSLGKNDDGNMVSRPRFLALSEFGPRSLIYHEGRTYRVVRAKLNVSASEHVSAGSELATVSARICSACGYGHLGETDNPEPSDNVCEHCGTPLTDQDRVNHLYKIETVETLQVERITVNDEERQRQGFELQTTYRFLPGPDGRIQKICSNVVAWDETIATLTYAPAARIWRINKGWRRRKDKNYLGFYINPVSGFWSKADSPDETPESVADTDIQNDRIPNQRIVPFVEDHRNILILESAGNLTEEVMVTLQAAIKRGIEKTFQIEESELVAEPLPNINSRKALLFYEAAEGGAGVLTRIASEPGQLAEVAGNALKLMHFNEPEEGNWNESLLNGSEHSVNDQRICEAGCYQCLLSYYNQPDHEKINRRNPDLLNFLVGLANAGISSEEPEGETGSCNPDDALAEWLREIERLDLRRPDALNVSIDNGRGTAAAHYPTQRALIFLSPPDGHIQTYLKDRGFRVLVFPPEKEEWTPIFNNHNDLFGK
jgi:superfamily II DNA/RNA helicase